jgi:protein gp37
VAELSKIEWTDHTFNPWIGCTKVSVGLKGACEHCYAEVATPTRAMHIQWGPGKPRHRTSAATWAMPFRYERNAATFYEQHGRRQRVFCASLADVFDNEVDVQWRADLFGVIRQTPSLDWLLLTKRIGNAVEMIAELQEPQKNWWPLPNVWLGATVVTQVEVDRDVPKLLATPAAKRFLSMEPLMESVDLDRGGWSLLRPLRPPPGNKGGWERGVDWVIVGGESGRAPRPMAQQWAESIRDQCLASGVPFFFKQGSEANWPAYKDFSRFAPQLQVREWPSS